MTLSLPSFPRSLVRAVSLLVLLLGASLLAQGQTIRYVKPTGTGDGSSWANASGNLQAMINASAANNQVWVATGTYKPTSTNDRTISFSMRADVAIYGGFVGTETTLGARGAVNPITGNPSSTTLSGDIGVAGNADNSYHVIRNPSGLTISAILDGFVITGGNANGDYSGLYNNGSGGGMINAVTGGVYFANCSPLIRNCSFQANSASGSGGAIYNDAYNEQSKSSPTLINCSFQGNTASSGGAMANNASQNSVPMGPSAESSPTLTNCSFQANMAEGSGGAMESYALGSRAYSSPTLTNCSFEGNTTNKASGSQGGAMSNNSTQAGFCSPTLTNCSFLNNSALGYIYYNRGGAIHNDGRGSTTIITLNNCSFQGNTASAEGGAIYSSGSFTAGPGTSVIRNVTYMTNCVLFGNGGAKTFYNDGARVYPTYTMLETSVTNYIPSSTNLTASTSPFTSPTSVALTANSPAIDAGNPETTNAGQTDLAGNPRIVGCKLDMGALEFQYTYLPLAINAQPATSSVVCAGTAVSVPVSVSGTVESYQWYKDSFANPVAGQTTATLTLSNPQTGDAGSYSLVVTNNCNSLTSTAFNLSVNSLPTVSISPSSVNICPGQSALLTASGASTYTWSNTTTGNTLSATTTGTYSVTGVDGNGNGCASTATATVTVHNPAVRISPSSVSICQGQSALLTASGASTYTWSNTTTGNTLSATTTGTYSVTGVDSYGCSNTATASVTVNSLPTVSISPSPSATVIQGHSVTLTAVATGATFLTWNTGSTSSSIVVSPSTSTLYSVTARSVAGCVASASLTITVTPFACGPVIYVTQDGSGQRDGSSWDNALGGNQLQIAINTAANCGGNRQVWVATGVYKPTTGSDRIASFALKNGVAIYGGFAGTETALTDRLAINPVGRSGGVSQPSSTTLSGNIGTVGNNDNSFHVINNPTGLTTTAVLDGFVITGGAGSDLGGGMYNDGSSPTIRNCSFVGNSVSGSGTASSRGGAMFNVKGSSPHLTNCSFLSNSVLGSGWESSSGFGGAIANFAFSSPQLTNCFFQANSVSGSTYNHGGAMANTDNSSPKLTNCVFLSNSASRGSYSGGAGTQGGAMFNNVSSNPQLTNCSFLANSVSGATSNQGGAMVNINSSSSPQMTNCVVFGNGGSNTFYRSGSPAIAATYSLFDNTVAGYSSDPTNLMVSASPFASSTSVDLAVNSPAIDAGLNLATGLNGISTDLAGNPRLVGCRVDMGALEYQGSTDQTFSITAQPASSSVVCVGTPVSVLVSVSGTVMSYQWYKDSFANPVAGQTSATLTLSNPQSGDGGSYSLVVIGACNSLTATAFSLSVNTPPTIASAGVSQTIISGAGATLAANTPTLGTGSWSVVSGPAVDLAQFSNVNNPGAVFTPAGGVGSYELVWTIANAPCTPTSSPLTITVIGANTAPVATANANQTATVGTAFSYTVNAFTDSETPNALTYSASISPANGLSFDAATRIISGAPSVSGVSSVTITASDAGGVSASTSFTITVSPAPVVVTSLTLSGFTASPTTLLTSGTTTLSAVVTGGTSPYSYVFSGPGTITPVANTASVSGLSAGVQTFTVVVTDATTPTSQTTSAMVSVTVNQANQPPTAAGITSQTATTGQSFSLNLTAAFADPESQTLTYTATGLPAGLVMADGVISGTPTAPGTAMVTITATDPGSLTASSSFTLTVNPAQINTLTATAVPGTICPNATAALTVSVNGGTAPFIYSWTGPGTITNANSATASVTGLATLGTSTFTVIVTDVYSQTATASADITVTQTPVVTVTPSSATVCAGQNATLTATEGSSYLWNTGANTQSIAASTTGTYSVTVTSINGCSATASADVTVSEAIVAPAISSVTAVQGSANVVLTAANCAGTLVWSGAASGSGSSITVSTATLGSFVYSIQCKVGACLSEPTSVTVIINPVPNAAPTVVNPIPSQTATVGQPFSYTLPATTFADDGGVASLIYTAAGLPLGLTLTNGIIGGTPTASGTSSVTVTATDAGGLSASTTFAMTVNAGLNRAPTTTGIASQTVTVDKPFSLNTASSFADPEGQSLTYEATKLPRGLSIDAATGLISGSPLAVGLTSITVTATDPGKLSVSSSFNLTVTEAPNTAPVAAPIANQLATVEVAFSLTVPAFSDAETPDQLTYAVSGLPKGLSFDAKTRLISGTPTTADVSSVTVTATDGGKLSASTVFTLTVNPAPANTGPVVVSPVANATISVGQSYSLTVASVFTDQETPTQLSYSVSGLPKGVSFSTKTNTITGSPNAAGVSVVTLTASDPGKLSTSTSYSLTVSAVGARLAAEALESTLKLQLGVYPNPIVGTSVSVQIGNVAGQSVRLRLVDMRGRVVHQQLVEVLTDWHTERVDLSHVPAGLFLLQVSTNNQSQTKTMLKE